MESKITMNKDRILTMNIGQELDILVAKELFGIKNIYYEEWDEDKISPHYIPSGKPWRTHQIDSRPLPRVSTDKLDAWLLWERTKFDIIWRIINPDKIEYCVGYSRGKDGDLVCYSRNADPEQCLSPVLATFPEAICKSLLLSRVIDKVEKG